MHINWIGYYPQYDGYGRFSSRIVKALQTMGTKVKPATMTHVDMPDWMLEQEGIDWDGLTISCLPPYFLQKVPGRHWLYSMTEGSRIPDDWVFRINNARLERVLVPCVHNKKAFEESGVLVPVSVVPGGTDPYEFRFNRYRMINQPYTFLTFADRGSRKGWEEVWEAFYAAFGGKTSGNKNVRLIIKARPKENSLVELLSKAKEPDPRIVWYMQDLKDMRELYAKVDCLVLPSRSEGWGMPHREAASAGLPVITQRYSGLDDGYTEQWSLPVEHGEVKPIPKEAATMLGNWRIADVAELMDKMLWCYENPVQAREFGASASSWIEMNQTWEHTAKGILDELSVGCAAVQMAL